MSPISLSSQPPSPVPAPEPQPSFDRDDAAALSVFGSLSALLEELPASWHAATAIPDRRGEPRYYCDCSARLTPLDDEEAPPCAVPPHSCGLPVTVKDISRSGIGLVHTEPIPWRQVLLTFDTLAGVPLQFVVRLKWCRFKSDGLYESGGPIVRVIGDDPSRNRP